MRLFTQQKRHFVKKNEWYSLKHEENAIHRQRKREDTQLGHYFHALNCTIGIHRVIINGIGRHCTSQ